MMRRTLIILITHFLLLVSVQGQPSTQFGEGIIVKKTGDTLTCFVELSMGYDGYVKYRLGEYGDVQTIPTKQIQSISTAFQYYENMQVGKKDKIMALTIRGPVNLYKFASFNDIPGPRGTVTFFGKPHIDYVIKKADFFYEVPEKDFKSTITNLLSDCKTLVQKINNNKYKFEDFENVIREYNNCNKTDEDLANEKKLIGKWESDLSDETTRNLIGEVIVTYTADGRILYDIIERKEIQRITLNYRIVGDSIFSSQSSQPDEQVTKYKFEGNNKLLLEINGIRSVFLRRSK